MILGHLVVDHLRCALRLVLSDADLPASVDAVRAVDHARRTRPNVDDHAIRRVSFTLALKRLNLDVNPGTLILLWK